jgi:hypothetical protein
VHMLKTYFLSLSQHCSDLLWCIRCHLFWTQLSQQAVLVRPRLSAVILLPNILDEYFANVVESNLTKCTVSYSARLSSSRSRRHLHQTPGHAPLV